MSDQTQIAPTVDSNALLHRLKRKFWRLIHITLHRVGCTVLSASDIALGKWEQTVWEYWQAHPLEKGKLTEALLDHFKEEYRK